MYLSHHPHGYTLAKLVGIGAYLEGAEDPELCDSKFNIEIVPEEAITEYQSIVKGT